MSNAQPSVSTIPDMLARSAQRYAQVTAIEEGSVKLNYADLYRASQLAARALMALGVQSGDRVAVWAPNIHEWIVAALGIHCAGAVLVPINTRLKGIEAADILRRSRARVLFCIGEFLDVRYLDMLAGHVIPHLEHRIVLRGAHAGEMGWEDFLARAAGTPEALLMARMHAITGNMPSDVMFTSGTTGQPKGGITAHAQNLRAFAEWSGIVGLREADRYLIVNPFFHAFGYKAGWLAALMRGATILPHLVFDAEAVLRRIEADRVSFLPGSPTLYLSLLAHPLLGRFDLSSLRVAVTGAASVAPELIRRMQQQLGFQTVLTAYGLTECCGLATVCHPGDDVETIATTCGRALPDTELRCIDEAGNDVAAGSVGEVLIRGYTVMQGYLDDDCATYDAIDSEGWLHTGDVGSIDEHGNLRITGRLKDMYIVGGFNCYPAEVENLITEHPAIAQVAVVGMPDERQGEVGRAYVVLRPGMSLSGGELIGWCRERMANYKVPRVVDIVDALPLNASGKVMKNALRDLAGGVPPHSALTPACTSTPSDDGQAKSKQGDLV